MFVIRKPDAVGRRKEGAVEEFEQLQRATCVSGDAAIPAARAGAELTVRL